MLHTPEDPRLQVKRIAKRGCAFKYLLFARAGVLIAAHPESRKRFSETLNEHFRTINLRVDAHASRRCSWFDLVELKLMSDVVDYFRRDRSLLFDVRINEGMFAKQVTHTRNSPSITLNHLHDFL